MDNRFDRIAIVGLGLIGASIAAALRHALPQIRLFGVDTDPRTREIALSRGWVDAAAAPAPQPAPDHSFRDFIQNEANLVILAIPADAAQSYFQDLVAWDYAGLITDAASTKSRICVQAASTLPDPAQFLPGHPMAGSEVNGIEGARADLFEGQHWILCPNADTRPEDFTDLHDLLKRIGARVVSLPREDHDRAIALISHVPHFTVEALHVRMENVQYETDTTYLQSFCNRLGIPLQIITTSFDSSLFTLHSSLKQKPPCFLCSWQRRKQLFNLAQELGCTKIALGHHQDDIIHTALMNLTFQGHFATMPAKLRMKKMPLTIIRPLCLCHEEDIARYAEAQGYERQKKLCPHEDTTNRTVAQQLFQQMQQMNPEARYCIWRALEAENKLIEY